MLLINVFLDFFQEHRALNALKALQAGLAKTAQVRRGGAFGACRCEAGPGDIVKLRLGEIVPADIQLIEGDFLLVDQSSLTGESLPVAASGRGDHRQHHRQAGRDARRGGEYRDEHRFLGRGRAGGSAQLESRSHFQEMVMQIGRFLIVVTVLGDHLIVWWRCSAINRCWRSQRFCAGAGGGSDPGPCRRCCR